MARVAAASLHLWEEPCLSGKNGAGAVFFSGCPLGCVFCQNREISFGRAGVELTDGRLAEVFRRLEEAGAETLDLVTPTHFAPSIFSALALARPKIPVAWNTGGYELAERIPELCRRIDIYLPDLKYFDPALAEEICGAPDYFSRALAALVAAVDRLGPCQFDERGILRRGVILRHLILPGHRADSMAILTAVRREVDPSKLRLSLMSQYTPFSPERLPRELRRPLTGFEYESVLQYAGELGFTGWSQDRRSASAEYLPAFDLTVLGEPLAKG